MTAKEARKCVAVLEKALGWNVFVYYTYISGIKQWLYDIKRKPYKFGDDSSQIFFMPFSGGEYAYESADSESKAVKQLVSYASGSVAYDLYAEGRTFEWKIPEFGSVEELKLKLSLMPVRKTK